MIDCLITYCTRMTKMVLSRGGVLFSSLFWTSKKGTGKNS